MRFGVSNFLSIRDPQELSFVASTLKGGHVDLLKPITIKESLLPAILVYGANASGKSAILAALRFFRSMIVDSQRQSPSSKIPTHPFRLEKDYVNLPSRLDCDFIVNAVRYNFGFVVNPEEFLEEWLYAYPSGNRQLWYARKGKDIKFGKYLRGQNSIIKDITRSNSLFLSAAAQSNHDQLLSIFNFFDKSVRGVSSQDFSPMDIAFSWPAGPDERAIAILREADTGINSAKIEKRDNKNLSVITKKILKLVSEEFEHNIEIDEVNYPNSILLGHPVAAGESVFFDMSFESKGTLRLLGLLKPILDALDNGGIIAIDEIDASLHTLLARELVALFSSGKTNKSGAQLLATTHDTNLLCVDNMRRDQVWFTEKDFSGATSLYPLTDIHTRNTDNLEKGYLQGRFGAIPFSGSIGRLLNGA